MTVTRAEITDIILEGLRDILRTRDDPADPDENFHLFGTGSAIDSLDMVGLIVHVEQAIAERTGRQIEIIDETALVSDDSPFRTVATLARLVESRLNA